MWLTGDNKITSLNIWSMDENRFELHMHVQTVTLTPNLDDLFLMCRWRCTSNDDFEFHYCPYGFLLPEMQILNLGHFCEISSIFTKYLIDVLWNLLNSAWGNFQVKIKIQSKVIPYQTVDKLWLW